MNTSLLIAESLTNKDVFISIIEINNSTQLAKKIRTFSFLNASLKEPRQLRTHTETMAGSEKPATESLAWQRSSSGNVATAVAAQRWWWRGDRGGSTLTGQRGGGSGGVSTAAVEATRHWQWQCVGDDDGGAATTDAAVARQRH
jgi:hypothetical protein